MNIERVMNAMRDLEVIIEEETGIQNPIESVGLRAKFYDILTTQYIMKLGPAVSYADIFPTMINGIRYIPVFPEGETESNTAEDEYPTFVRGNSQLDDKARNMEEKWPKSFFDPSTVDEYL